MNPGNKNLLELVDSYGRTVDAEFGFGELLEFLVERLGSVDEAQAYDLAVSSSYLFESWAKPEGSVFIPRRLFFQGSEFRITPSRQEVEGGFLFPGHHFMPFVSREVFPGDFWLVLPNGSAPHVQRVEIPRPLAMDSLALFGETQSLEYLVTDEPENEKAKNTISVTAYDLRDFYSENHFKPGDSLMVRVLDWLQGVFAISYAPANQPADAEDLDGWSLAMHVAYDRMQHELGTEGDCYEQLAIMMLLAKDDEIFPVMKTPPQSLSNFIQEQEGVTILQLANRAVFKTEEVPMNEFDDMMSPLDAFFQELGLPCSEAEAEAYMRDSIFHGVEDSDAVLARVVKGRSLVFKSADDQDEFHEMWHDLWSDVIEIYSSESDPYGKLRSDLLLLNDQCFAVIRGLDVRTSDPQKLAVNPAFREFGMLTMTLSHLLGLLNFDEGAWDDPDEKLDKIASILFEKLPGILEELKGK